jgi:hypothetical protein
MNYTPDFGWYYVSPEDRAPAWSSVDYFFDFLTGTPAFAEQNGGIGPFGKVVPHEEAEPGDLIQFANSRGEWYHTVVITGMDGAEIFVSAQTNDALDRPLSSYNFTDARYLHVEGVRIGIDDRRCYEILLAGGVLPMENE